MRRLLCNPKAWRELMKMNLEKLSEVATILELSEGSRSRLIFINACLVLKCVNSASSALLHSLLYISGISPPSLIFYFFSIHQVGSWHCHTILCPPPLT